MSTRAAAIGIGILFLAGGCIIHDHRAHPHGGPPGHARAKIHAHGADCGHYYVDGGWLVVPTGHLHADGCGHLRVGGVWHGVKVKVRG